MTSPQPLRSVLLLPGHDEERLRGALGAAVDAVLLDLEGAVPETRQAEARELVRTMVPEFTAAGKQVMVRVNPIASGDTAADVEAVVVLGVYGVALAKVERPRDVVALDGLLAAAERRAGMPIGSLVVHPLIENAQALRHAYGIARASARVAHMGGIVAPGGDLARSVGFRATPGGDETRYLRAKVLVDARAAGVRFPLSGIPVERDEAHARAFAREARALGYDGLLIAYRSHAPVVNETFTPSEAEVMTWQRIARGDAAGRRAPDASTVAWARANLVVAAHFGVRGAGDQDC